MLGQEFLALSVIRTPPYRGQFRSPDEQSSMIAIRVAGHSGSLPSITTSAFLVTNPTNRNFRLPLTCSQSASNALENVSDEVFRVPKAVAPLCVCGGGRLCGHNFVERFALFLEGGHSLASAVN